MILAVLLLRLPFLNQAIQGDDHYYLTGAMYAQIDPLHPAHGKYIFLGREVDLRGHPHPPLNMWMLGGLLAVFGDINEILFHAAYILLSLIAAAAMWSLARRFSPRPLAATLLFLAVPAFVVNGNSLESDVPFLAYWMASIALFVRAADARSPALLAAAAVCFLPASLAAYQSVLLIPIGAVYLWLYARDWKPGWFVLAAPAAALAGWQLFERITGGALPAGVLAGYLEGYALQALGSKLQNAVALTVHMGWIVFPALAALAFGRSRWLWAAAGIGAAAGAVLLDPHPLFWMTFGIGLLVIGACVLSLRNVSDRDRFSLAAWVTLFFAAALVLFFAGSARYLLPLAAPLCLLVTREPRVGRVALAGGIALQLLLALALSVANYQHWEGYRRFVASLGGLFAERRVWINGEWGLRYYAETEGGLPLTRGQAVQPGEVVLTSAVSYPIDYTTGGGTPVTLAETEIQPVLPFRLIGLNTRSAYSTVTLGYRPFDVVFGPLDRVRAEAVVEREPQLSYLPMNAPEAETQIVSGIHKLEEGAWRWMAGRAVVLLKAPAAAAPVEASLYLPESAPASEATLLVDGRITARQSLSGPGSFSLRSSDPVHVEGSRVTVEIVVDRTFSAPGDDRDLGLVITAVGFKDG